MPSWASLTTARWGAISRFRGCPNLRCLLSWVWVLWHWCSVAAARPRIFMPFAEAPALVGACFILAADLNQDPLERLLHHAPLSLSNGSPDNQINAYGPVPSLDGTPNFHKDRILRQLTGR